MKRADCKARTDQEIRQFMKAPNSKCSIRRDKRMWKENFADKSQKVADNCNNQELSKFQTCSHTKNPFPAHQLGVNKA